MSLLVVVGNIGFDADSGVLVSLNSRVLVSLNRGDRDSAESPNLWLPIGVAGCREWWFRPVLDHRGRAPWWLSVQISSWWARRRVPRQGPLEQARGTSRRAGS